MGESGVEYLERDEGGQEKVHDCSFLDLVPQHSGARQEKAGVKKAKKHDVSLCRGTVGVMRSTESFFREGGAPVAGWQLYRCRRRLRVVDVVWVTVEMDTSQKETPGLLLSCSAQCPLQRRKVEHGAPQHPVSLSW